MSTTQPITENMAPEVALAKIEAYTKAAADAARECLESANLDNYKHFLNTMYHYTRNTGEKATEASENVHTDELRDFFLHFVEEEDWHYKLAFRDLEAFGLVVSDNVPEAVLEFDRFWASLKGKHSNYYLGALYVFENIVKYVADDTRAFIDRLGLKKKQCKWMSVHAEADIEHGDEVAEITRKYIAENPEAAIAGAQEASAVWVGVMQEAFQQKKAA